MKTRLFFVDLSDWDDKTKVCFFCGLGRDADAYRLLQVLEDAAGESPWLELDAD